MRGKCVARRSWRAAGRADREGAGAKMSEEGVRGEGARRRRAERARRARRGGAVAGVVSQYWEMREEEKR